MARSTAAHRGARRSWFGRGRTRALLYFTDRATVAGTSISSGTMHVDLAANFRVRPESYSWAALSPTNLAPGSSKSALLTVSNNSRGAVPFSYRVNAAATGTLGTALKVTVRRGGSSNGTTCSGGTLLGSADATLNGFDQSAGANLAPTQAHSMCVQVTLPAGSSVSPSSSSALTFTFPATQVP
jgi:hypothetical protein